MPATVRSEILRHPVCCLKTERLSFCRLCYISENSSHMMGWALTEGDRELDTEG